MKKDTTFFITSAALLGLLLTVSGCSIDQKLRNQGGEIRLR